MLAIGTARPDPERPITPAPTTLTLACPEVGQGSDGFGPAAVSRALTARVATDGGSDAVGLGAAAVVATAVATGSVAGAVAGGRRSGWIRIRATPAPTPATIRTPIMLRIQRRERRPDAPDGGRARAAAAGFGPSSASSGSGSFDTRAPRSARRAGRDGSGPATNR